MFGTAGCTTMETVHASPEALAEKRVKVGDKVTLQYVTGHAEKAKLTNIGAESLTVMTDDGRALEVPYADLLSLDYKRVEVLKTAGATVGVVVLSAAVVAGAGLGAAVMVAGGM